MDQSREGLPKQAKKEDELADHSDKIDKLDKELKIKEEELAEKNDMLDLEAELRRQRERQLEQQRQQIDDREKDWTRKKYEMEKWKEAFQAKRDAEFKKDNEKWAEDRAKGAKLKRAQELRQSWKQKGHSEDQATYARDFPRLYALDVVTQQGKELSASIKKGMGGPKGQDPNWRKDAAEQIRKHRERVEKIREMPQDTETSDEEGMDVRRAMFDRLRGDGEDTVSGMKGAVPRIVRR